MAKDPINHRAWPLCGFCSMSDAEIVGLVKAEEWGSLPLRYRCAWSRICTAAAYEQLDMGGALWRRLSSARAGLNNRPSLAGGESSWTETTCSTYMRAREEAEVRAKAISHGLVAANAASCWFGSFECTGVLVGRVVEDSAADRAGLRANDILKAVDGAEVRTRLELDERLARIERGRRARITVRRAGRFEHFWIARAQE